MVLSLHHISKSYGQQAVLNDFSLSLRAGELLTLLGPSGCGKTTLLRLMAGLEVPDQGHVYVDGEDTSGWLPQQQRVGFVFQNYALFRHMTVADNVSFGLRVKPRAQRLRPSAMQARVRELLSLVQLEGLDARLPHQLSGGQRQRVALARALATEPRLLLLDEPFGALDAKVRRELRTSLRALQRQLALTCVLVTHDQDEAWLLSDHVVLMQQGRIEQQGAPEVFLRTPATPFAASFLGDGI